MSEQFADYKQAVDEVVKQKHGWSREKGYHVVEEPVEAPAAAEPEVVEGAAKRAIRSLKSLFEAPTAEPEAVEEEKDEAPAAE